MAELVESDTRSVEGTDLFPNRFPIIFPNQRMQHEAEESLISPVIRLVAPNVRRAVDQPGEVQGEGVPHDARYVPGHPALLPPQEPRDQRGQHEA